MVELKDAGPPRRSNLARLAKAFLDRSYRHAYMGRNIRGFLALQMKSLRGDRTHKQFGDIVGKPQSVISRIEKQADKNISIQTLIDIADKLDIAVVIRFVDFPTFLKYTEDYSDDALHPPPYDDASLYEFLMRVEKSLREGDGSGPFTATGCTPHC